MIQPASSRYTLSLALLGLTLLLWGARFSSVHSASPVRFISPLPSPRPTVWGWSEPPPAPTLDVLLTPSQVRHFSLTPASPLPTPTPLPDFVPPQTVLQITGQAGTAGWYRSPVSITFRITDNFFAGVTEVQLDQATDWTYREYYYPPVTIQAEGIHDLRYYSIDIAQNREATQATQIRLDRTPPQLDPPQVAGQPLPNGWYHTPVTVTLAGHDALSGVAGFEERTAAGLWQRAAATTVISTTTQQTYTWRALDAAGNSSPDQTLALWVDLTPPTTTHTVAALPASGWYTVPVTVTLTAVDVGAGLFQSYYRLIPLGSWQRYGGPFVVSAAGVQTVAYQSSDRALNLEAPHTLTLPLDLAPPQLTLTRDPPATDGVWSTTPVTVTLAARDEASGVAALRYRLADEAAWLPYTTPLLLQPTTVQTLTVVAQDGAGHQSHATVPLGVDRQPPTTRLLLNHPLATSGWYTQPLTLTLVATDAETGLGQTLYQWPGQAPAAYTQALGLRTEGQTTLTWFSLDRARNQEAPQTHTFALDWTPPLLTYIVDGQAIAPGWVRPGATIVVSATDAVAGVAAVDYAVGNAAWQPYRVPLTPITGGAYPYRFRARDQAGNSTLTTLTLGIDTQPPTTTLRLTPPPMAAGWHTQPVTVTLVATDSGSGLFQTQVRWAEQAAPTVYQAPLHLTQEGIIPLTWFSLDRTLNQEAPQTHTFALDWTPPLITYTISGDAVAANWYRSAARLAVTATDALAGVAAVAYAVDDGPWQAYTTTVTLTAGGRHVVHLRAQDAATNSAHLTTQPFGMDTLAPHTAVTLQGGRAAHGWYHTPVTVTLTTTDTGAGVVERLWRLNGGPWQAYTVPVVVTSERVNLLEYYAVDAAGNREAPQYIVFSIDRTDPATRVSLLVGEMGRNGWYISPVTLTLSAQDLESGLQVLEAAVDDQPWQPYTQPLRLAEEGLHQIRYRAGVAGGRLETTRTLTVALDLTAPVITSTLPATFTYANLTLPAFYTLTDSLSGVVTSTFLLDGAPYAPGQPVALGSHQVELVVVNGAGLITRRTQTFIVVGGRLYLPLVGR